MQCMRYLSRHVGTQVHTAVPCSSLGRSACISNRCGPTLLHIGFLEVLATTRTCRTALPHPTRLNCKPSHAISVAFGCLHVYISCVPLAILFSRSGQCKVVEFTLSLSQDSTSFPFFCNCCGTITMERVSATTSSQANQGSASRYLNSFIELQCISYRIFLTRRRIYALGLPN